MTVRKIGGRGSNKITGRFPSLKLGRPVWWESQLERDFIYLLDFDGEVISYREQPLRIFYWLNGKRHFYTPDFLVERKGGRQIYEVKYEEDAAKPENDALFRSVTPICREAGCSFLVATENDIRVQPRLDNIKLLWRYSRAPIVPQHLIYCRELMSRGGAICLADALAYFETKGAPRTIVYGLIYRGMLDVDLMQPISPNTTLVRPAAERGVPAPCR